MKLEGHVVIILSHYHMSTTKVGEKTVVLREMPAVTCLRRYMLLSSEVEGLFNENQSSKLSRSDTPNVTLRGLVLLQMDSK